MRDMLMYRITKKSILVVSLICFTLNVGAQAPADTSGSASQQSGTPESTRHPKKHIQILKTLVDKVLDLRDSNSIRRTDTFYIQRLPNRLRIKINTNFSGEKFDIVSTEDNIRSEVNLTSRRSTSISLNLSYRGLGVAFSFRPFKGSGQKNLEFNVNAYGNRLGADFLYMKQNTYSGSLYNSDLDESSEISNGMLLHETISANFYYVFNSRRFSYPAAFSQSWIQKKSSGSIIAGLSYQWSRFGTEDKGIEADIDNGTIKHQYLGIGAGYGYNLILFKNWLFHLSLLPECLVYAHGTASNNTKNQRMSYRFPDFYLVSRFAVVHHFRHFFTGLSAVLYTTDIGNKYIINIKNTKWRAKFFIGFKI